MVGKDLIMATLFGSGGGSSGSGGGGGIVMKTGEITPTEEIVSGTASESGLVIEHGLGVQPDFFIIGLFNDNAVRNNELALFVYRSSALTGSEYPSHYVVMGNSAGSNWALVDTYGTNPYPVTDKEITIYSYNISLTAPVIVTQTYKWIAIGGLSE